MLDGSASTNVQSGVARCLVDPLLLIRVDLAIDLNVASSPQLLQSLDPLGSNSTFFFSPLDLHPSKVWVRVLIHILRLDQL
jgi:hypothetical protein